MAPNKEPSWEESTRDGINKLETGLSAISAGAAAADTDFLKLAKRVDSYRDSLAEWARSLGNARGLVRDLAYKRLDIEVSYSVEYLKRRLRIEELVGALNFSNDAYSFQVGNPVELLTEESPSSPCDLFGPDQIGLRARAAIVTKENPPQTFSMTLHMAFGLSFAGDEGSMFLAHDVRLRDAAGVAAYDIAALESSMSAAIRKRLEAEKLPTPAGGGIVPAGSEVRYVTSTVGKHVSVLASVVAKTGQSPIAAHQPLKPLGALPPDTDEVVRLSNQLFFTLMKARLEDYLTHAAVVELHADNYNYSVVQDPGDPSRRALRLAASAYCIDPFNDREDLGTVTVTATFSTKQWPDKKGFDLILQPKAAFKLKIVTPDPITVLSACGAVRLSSAVEDDAVSAAIKYDFAIECPHP